MLLTEGFMSAISTNARKLTCKAEQLAQNPLLAEINLSEWIIVMPPKEWETQKKTWCPKRNAVTMTADLLEFLLYT